MNFELCESRGFDAEAISGRLSLLGLAGPERHAEGMALEDLVVRPNAESIVDSFYTSLVTIEDFNSIVAKHSDPGRLKDTQRRYLLSLGVGFDRPEYFEERLRIGAVHQTIGIPQSLYQCTFQSLQFLLMQHIPQQVQAEKAFLRRWFSSF